MDVTGKVAVITGGGSGLGRFFALGLAAAGADVVVADLDRAAADRTAGDVGGRAVGCDVADPGAARELMASARPQILINNAGGWTAGDRQFPDAAFAGWNAALELNLRAPMLLSQLLAEQGGGAVVNIASSAARGSAAYGSPEYAATKAALIRFTTACAGLAQSHGVRMTCLVPGWIGLERALREAGPGQALVPPEQIVAVALELIRDDRAGVVVELPEGEVPRQIT